MAPEAAPLGANNGRMPDYPHEDASSFTPKKHHFGQPSHGCGSHRSCYTGFHLLRLAVKHDSGYSPDHGYSSFQFIAIIIHIASDFGNLRETFSDEGSSASIILFCRHPIYGACFQELVIAKIPS
ncbi:hypothetical protein [Paenibacillus illinoisensis]|uniref:hypothetical protein n=1 Tax=Paenibacillus illinoisensis TaxID=59845 RepID=UPI0036F37542